MTAAGSSARPLQEAFRAARSPPPRRRRCASNARRVTKSSAVKAARGFCGRPGSPDPGKRLRVVASGRRERPESGPEGLKSLHSASFCASGRESPAVGERPRRGAARGDAAKGDLGKRSQSGRRGPGSATGGRELRRGGAPGGPAAPRVRRAARWSLPESYAKPLYRAVGTCDNASALLVRVTAACGKRVRSRWRKWQRRRGAAMLRAVSCALSRAASAGASRARAPSCS